MEFSNNDNNERKPPKTPPNKDQLGLDVRTDSLDADGQTLSTHKSNTVLRMIQAEEKKRNSIMPNRPSAMSMRPLALPGGDEQIGRRLTIGRPSRLNPSKSGTFQRRVSNYGATGPLAGRNSVNVRKTSVVLTKFDEAMPIGSNVRRVSAINNNLQPNNQNMHNRRVSNIGRKSIIPMSDPMLDPMNKPWTIENPERRESKNNAVANVIRKMSTNIRAAMSTKEEESMSRVSRFLWIFLILGAILAVGSALLATFGIHIAAQISLSVVKLIVLILAWLLPRKILSKSFAKALEKSQRFQNLQNVFIQKEIQEFNRDLETQGFF